jgi:S1-C subfamily serine protease
MSHLRWALPLAALLTCPCRARADDAAALERAVQQAVRKAEPSVACVLVSRSPLYRKYEGKPSTEPGRLGPFRMPARPFHHQPERWRELRRLDLSDPDNTPESYGSGVVLDRSGLVLTNAHVVRGATKVFVRLPGGAGSYADIHALDARSDLAVLRLIDRVAGLKPLPLGDGGSVRKGQFVVLLANPFAAGFQDGSPSASFGIVSNLRRRLPGGTSEVERNKLALSQFATLIQTDARLGLGCSGGALVNLKGELIGLTTARAALTGVETPGGFALPLDAGMKRIVATLLRGEEVEYGFLGIRFQRDDSGGVRVSGVIGGTGASRAGLRMGDYILSVGGVRVRRHDDVFLAVGTQLAGSTVTLERARTPDGPGEKVEVTLAKYYVPLPSIASKRPPARGGLRVDYASLAVQRGASGDDVPEGVLVREVVPGSAAERAGLRPEQVIAKVEGRPVLTPAEFYRALASAKDAAELTLQNGRRVTLKLGER